MSDFTFRAPLPEPPTEAQIAAAVAALDMPDGWSRADDVALMEGLFRGLKLGEIGAPIGKTLAQMQARFWALRKAATGGATVFTLDAQTRLLAVVRERANG